MEREDRLIIVSFKECLGPDILNYDCSKTRLNKDCSGIFAAMDLSGSFFYGEIGDNVWSEDKLIDLSDKDAVMNYVHNCGGEPITGCTASYGSGTIKQVSDQFDEWLYRTKASRNNIIFLGTPKSMCVASSMCTYENDFIWSHYRSEHARIGNGHPLTYVKYCRDRVFTSGLDKFVNSSEVRL